MWPFSPTPSILPVDAAQKLGAPHAILIDVRTPPEFDAGHAHGAVNYPLSALNATAAETLKKYSEVYVMCRSGGRSATATSQLITLGVNAINVAGGLSAWQAANLPLA